MSGIHDLALFVFSCLLLNITPGPDSLLVMNRSAAQGWRAGSAAAFGIGTGIFVHVFAAALGLSAALAASATAFTVVKYLGAAYLLYIGLTLLRGKNGGGALATAAPVATGARISCRRIYLQGFMTNALNPKVAMFFLAFVPQFIAPAAPDKALAFILLGCVFNATGMLWTNFLAVATAFASNRLRVNRLVARCFNRFTGLVFILLALKLALSDRS